MVQEMDTIKRIWDKLPRQYFICFFTGLVTGFLTHALMLTNKLPNWDDVNSFGAFGSGMHVGRWFLIPMHSMNGVWSNPWVNGSISIILIAAASCLILSCLELRSTTSAVLTPMILVTFPSVASTMTFMFTVDMYMAGLVMVCLGVWLCRNYKFGFLGAIPLFVLSLGTYQAYICFAISLLIIGIFLSAIHEAPFKKLASEIGKAVLALAGSVLIYMIVTRIVNPEIGNSDYAGIGSMGQISLAELPRMTARCYKRVLEYFTYRPFSFVTPSAQAVNILICILLLFLFSCLVFRKKLWSKKWNFAAALLTIAVLPVGIAFVYIMSPEASFSMLMFFQYALVYLLLLVFLEQYGDERKKLLPSSGGAGKTAKWISKNGFRALSAACAALLFFTAYRNYVVTGEAYFRMYMANERVGAYFNRILAALEMTPGYREGDEFAVLGHVQDNDDQYTLPEHYPMDDERYADFLGISPEFGLLTEGVRDNYIRIYFGYQAPYLGEDKKEALKATEEYKHMPVYPADGCIAKIDGTWVVKISD